MGGARRQPLDGCIWVVWVVISCPSLRRHARPPHHRWQHGRQTTVAPAAKQAGHGHSRLGGGAERSGGGGSGAVCR